MADIQTSTWSESAASNTAAPPDGAPENHARNKVNDIQRETMGAIKREWNRSHPTVTSAGTEPAFTLSYTTAPTYVQGIIFTFLAHATPSGNVTLNVNSLGAKKVYNLQGSAQLGSAAWPANARIMVSYDTSLDSSNGGFVWLNQGTDSAVAAASETAAGKVELATNAEVVTGTDTARAVTPAGLAAAYRGKMAVFIPAGTMIPQVTNGPSRAITEHATNDVMVETLDFDQTTSELAQFGWRMPESWNESTVTFRSVWTAAAGSAAETFICGLKAMALSDDDAIDGSWGTGVTVSDALIATGDVHISAESTAVTVGGTPAAGDYVIFNVYRDISDTLAADARLIGIVLNVTTNAGVDG